MENLFPKLEVRFFAKVLFCLLLQSPDFKFVTAVKIAVWRYLCLALFWTLFLFDFKLIIGFRVYVFIERRFLDILWHFN